MVGGGGLEEDWRRIGGGLEEDWRRIFVDFRGFSRMFVDFRGFSWIVVDFRGFSWIFVDFRDLLWGRSNWVKIEKNNCLRFLALYPLISAFQALPCV